jgi:hypothetical protein
MKFQCDGKETNSSEASEAELNCKKGCTNCEENSCQCECHQKDDDSPTIEA